MGGHGDHLPVVPLPGPVTQPGFSMLGMWHTASPRGTHPLLPCADTSAFLAELLTFHSTTHSSLESVLRSALCHVFAPPPPLLPPHVPQPLHPHLLCLRHSIALTRLLRQCATWRPAVDQPQCSPSLQLRSKGRYRPTLCLTQRPEQRTSSPSSLQSPPDSGSFLPLTPQSSATSSSVMPIPHTCVGCCPTCTSRSPPTRPLTPQCGALNDGALLWASCSQRGSCAPPPTGVLRPHAPHPRRERQPLYTRTATTQPAEPQLQPGMQWRRAMPCLAAPPLAHR